MTNSLATAGIWLAAVLPASKRMQPRRVFRWAEWTANTALNIDEDGRYDCWSLSPIVRCIRARIFSSTIAHAHENSYVRSSNQVCHLDWSGQQNCYRSMWNLLSIAISFEQCLRISISLSILLSFPPARSSLDCEFSFLRNGKNIATPYWSLQTCSPSSAALIETKRSIHFHALHHRHIE